MKSMLIKDISVVRSKLKWYYLLLCAAIDILCIAFFNFFGMIYINFMVLMLLISLPQNMISEDQKVGFDQFSLALPLSLKDNIITKYLLPILLGFLVTIVFTGINYMGNQYFNELPPSYLIYLEYVSWLFLIVMVSLIIPLYYKFGSYAMSCLVLVLVIVINVGAQLLDHFHVDVASFSTIPIPTLLIAATIMVLCILTLSYQVTLRIYEEKIYA